MTGEFWLEGMAPEQRVAHARQKAAPHVQHLCDDRFRLGVQGRGFGGGSGVPWGIGLTPAQRAAHERLGALSRRLVIGRRSR